MISDVMFRLRALFRRKSAEAELDEELRTHFKHQVGKYVQSGLLREERQRGPALSVDLRLVPGGRAVVREGEVT